MELKRWNNDQSIPTSMPVMDLYLARHKDRQPFKDVTMLLIQHQLGNQVPQAKALIEMGLDPEKLFWLDIPYTATPLVCEHLIKNLGIPAGNFITTNYTILEPYANYQRRRTQEILRRFLDNPPEHLVVLDDGAYFIEAMATYKKRLPLVSIVEQTTRGFIKINGNAALKQTATSISMINVAQSQPKTTLEPPFIGYAIWDSLERRLKEKILPKKSKCLVLGFGSIGKNVASSLREAGFSDIYIFDTQRKKIKDALEKGYRIWDKIPGPRFSLVVGCSGTSSFGIGDYVHLEDGALLASASSGSVELSRQNFIELAASHDQDDILLHTRELDVTNIHSDLHFDLLDRHAVFVNGGFPVNFDGRVNCIPAHYIQPTPVMMVEAARMAAQITKKGHHKFSPAFCKWLREEFIKELGDENIF